MVESELFDLFPKHFIDKQVEISYSGGTITNEELFSESMEITESLCSESELRFGSCEASQLKFKIANVFLPMINQTIGVQMKLEDHHDTPFQIGKYKVASDTPTADRRWRDIVAYDAMYDILNADVAAWYNQVLPDMESSMTMREFRRSFLKHFEIAEADPAQELVNDSMTVQRTVDPAEMSGKDVITAICEINGCFGHINREGKFAYIYLPQYIQGLYPANDLYPDHAPDYLPYMQETGHLYPKDPKGIPVGRRGTYISCKYEDFLTKEIKKLQIRKEENDIGVIINDNKSGNTYIIQDNFLVYGKGTDELRPIAENIFSKIQGIIYRPFDAEVQGNPCIEVGDTIRLSTKYELVESYVLERTLKGIQALRDTLSGHGTEMYSENLNSVHTSIVELRGKSNVLTRTIEETKSDLRDTEKNLRSTITQTASEIRSEVEKADAELSSTITQTATQIRSEVEKADAELSSTITQTATQIRSEVEDTRKNLQSQITQNAGQIDLRVRKDSIIADINLTPEKVTIQAGKIDLKGLVNADELVTKFATITTLNSTKATLESVIATKATITDLNAVKATVNSISADYASVGDLNAAKADLSSLIADKASIGDLNAVEGRFNSLNASNITAGTLSVNRLNIQDIIDKFSSHQLICTSLNCSSITIGGYLCSIHTKTIGSTSITYVGV